MSEENTPDASQTANIPAESSTAQTEAAETATTAQEETKPETVPKKDFNKAYWKQKQTERENAELRRQLEERNNSVQETPATTQGEPTLEQFDYDQDAYMAAIVDHRVKSGISNAFAERDKQAQERKQQTEAQEVSQKFNNNLAQYIAENPEYEEVAAAAGGKAFAPHVNQAVLHSDNGPAIDHHLLVNPDVAEKLGAMSPIQATIEIGKISAQLSKPKEVKTTGAPPPIETVGSGAGSPTSDRRYDENTSMEDYYKVSMGG